MSCRHPGAIDEMCIDTNVLIRFASAIRAAKTTQQTGGSRSRRGVKPQAEPQVPQGETTTYQRLCEPL